MAETSKERADAIKTTATAVQKLDPKVQATAITAAVPPPDQKTAGTLWIVLVSGLLAIIAVAVIGLIVLIVKDKTTATLVTVFTGTLTGLLGLFAPSPLKSGSTTGAENK
jgi:hypothetical protein